MTRQSRSYSGSALTHREIDVDLTKARDRLAQEFEGVFGRETIARLMDDSLTSLSEARVLLYLPLIAERFARERLRALAKVEGRSAPFVPSVLFLCEHNAGRSQMAAAWLRHLVGDRVLIWSAGSQPGSEVNRAAVEAMREVGIDISQEFPKPWTDEVVRAADVVVTMGCGDACPVFPGIRYLDWEIDDPSGKEVAEVRPIRDAIERRVRTLLSELNVAAN
jgi:protein-tyrosine-phosphatase